MVRDHPSVALSQIRGRRRPRLLAPDVRIALLAAAALLLVFIVLGALIDVSP
jgi:hypothetical protein